jgi:DMSO/TMAO reductase YedYZ molybdopterin-dependent catalytic subunit
MSDTDLPGPTDEPVAGPETPATPPAPASEPNEPTPPPEPAPEDPQAARRELYRLSRRSFVTGAIAGAAALGGWKWLVSRPEASGLPWPLRWALEANDEVASRVFAPARLAPTFRRAQARMPKVNGDIGLETPIDLVAWRLALADSERGDGAPLAISLAEIRALPRVEMTTQLMCIEGWSEVVHWGGVRLADFVARFAPAWADPRQAPGQYVSLATPDKAYYVGLDLASALHPQTLLCDSMDGEPLSDAHGAPLRLVIPVKYGIKNIKRIGFIGLHRDKPADYWADDGYDWFAGL